MINLTNLVKEYKQTKNKLIIDKIYLELKITIKQKAKFIYYHKWYPLNLYHPCKYCRNCKQLNNVPKEEHITICKDCDVCKCIKGWFNLRKDGLCEYQDVEQDLNLEILRVIDNYDKEKGDFNSYLFSCLWNFIPSFITKNFVTSLQNKSLTKINEEGNEIEIDPPNEQEEKPEISITEIFSTCKTDLERKVLEIILNNKKISNIKIAKELGINPQLASQILKKLKQRIKKLL